MLDEARPKLLALPPHDRFARFKHAALLGPIVLLTKHRELTSVYRHAEFFNDHWRLVAVGQRVNEPLDLVRTSRSRTNQAPFATPTATANQD